MADEIIDTQIPSQLEEYTDSESDKNNDSETESIKKKVDDDDDDNDNHVGKVEEYEDDDDDIFGDKDNENDDEEEDDIFGDKDDEDDNNASNTKKRHASLIKGSQASQPLQKKPSIDTETDFLSQIDAAEKIELVNHQLPPKGYNAFIMQFPPSVDIQKNVYDSQKYEMKDPKKFLRHTIRWRRRTDNKVVRESNTRLVRWSDGSFTLNIGATAIPLRLTRLPGYNLLGIKSNGRTDTHTVIKRKLKVCNPPDAMDSMDANSRFSVARMIYDNILESEMGIQSETTAAEEARSRKVYGKGKLSLESAVGGDEYDNDINDTQDDKRAAASIRDAKKSKRKHKK